MGRLYDGLGHPIKDTPATWIGVCREAGTEKGGNSIPPLFV